MTPSPTSLHLTKGSANDIAVELLDEADGPETLSGLTITLEIRETAEAAPIMTIGTPIVSANIATFSMTQVQANALVVGRYLGFVKGTSGGKDYRLYDPFFVEVGPG